MTPVCCAFAFLMAVGPLPAGDESVRTAAGQREISDDTARLELARVLQKDSRAREAITIYRQILSRRSDNLAARVELAQLLLAVDDPLAAEALLNEVPRESLGREALLVLAAIAETNSRFRDAQSIYESLVKSRPSDQVTRFRLAQVLAWQRKYEESISQFAILAEERPRDIQLLRTYAQVLGWAGKNGESISIWERTFTNSK